VLSSFGFDDFMSLQPRLYNYLNQYNLLRSPRAHVRAFLLLNEMFDRWQTDTLCLFALNLEAVWNMTHVYAHSSVISFE
jgi:hypothetical protein